MLLDKPTKAVPERLGTAMDRSSSGELLGAIWVGMAHVGENRITWPWGTPFCSAATLRVCGVKGHCSFCGDGTVFLKRLP